MAPARRPVPVASIAYGCAACLVASVERVFSHFSHDDATPRPDSTDDASPSALSLARYCLIFCKTSHSPSFSGFSSKFVCDAALCRRRHPSPPGRVPPFAAIAFATGAGSVLWSEPGPSRRAYRSPHSAATAAGGGQQRMRQAEEGKACEGVAAQHALPGRRETVGWRRLALRMNQCEGGGAGGQHHAAGVG